MKILVYAHQLEIGGSQTNAIDLADALRARGHHLTFYAAPGPAGAVVRARGFELTDAPLRRTSPSPTAVYGLAREIARQRPDVVHAWDWPQYFDAAIGAVVAMGVPVVGSNMSMAVSRSAPRTLPLTYGTPQLVAKGRSVNRARVVLLEPPVNTDLDNPDAADGAELRAHHGVAAHEVAVVVVSRLIGWMKLDGILQTLRAVDRLAADVPVKFLIVGDGTSRPQIEAEAAKVNDGHGRRVVVLAGALADPRPAYAAADVVVGMGGSILRGMAFGKPAVVLGEAGFSLPFTPQTADRFLSEGLFGYGEVGPLDQQLRPLIADAGLRREIGGWSRELVVRRFSHHAAAETFEGFLEEARSRRPSRPAVAADSVVAMARRAAGRLRRHRGESALGTPPRPAPVVSRS